MIKAQLQAIQKISVPYITDGLVAIYDKNYEFINPFVKQFNGKPFFTLNADNDAVSFSLTASDYNFGEYGNITIDTCVNLALESAGPQSFFFDCLNATQRNGFQISWQNSAEPKFYFLSYLGDNSRANQVGGLYSGGLRTYTFGIGGNKDQIKTPKWFRINGTTNIWNYQFAGYKKPVSNTFNIKFSQYDKLKSYRMYNRVLTQDEVKFNYMIDKERFGV